MFKNRIANKFFLFAILLFSVLKNQAQQVPNDYLIADSLFGNFNYKESLPILDGLLATNLTDSLKAEIFFRKGAILLSNDIEDTAMDYYKKSLQLLEKLNNSPTYSRVLRNIGYIHQSKKNYTESLEYFNLALSKSINPKDSMSVLLSICTIYQLQKNAKKVSEIIFKYITKFKSGVLNYQHFLINSNIGIYYNSINKHDSSLYYHLKSIQQLQSEDYLLTGYNNIADEYRILKNYAKASKYLDSALLIPQSIVNQESRLSIYDTYFQLDSTVGDFQNALKYSRIGRLLSDSIFNSEKAKVLSDGEIKYQATKKQAANEILQKNITIKNRNFAFSLIALGFVALLGGLSFRNYKLKQRANKILTTQKNQVQQLADDLNEANQTKARLFSTISHDLRGPVSTLYASLKMQEMKAGQGLQPNTDMSEQTVQLLDTLEDLLVWSKSQMDRFVPMPVRIHAQELMDEMKDFYLQSATSKQINLVNNCTADIQFRTDENILRTMLRNAIANAISHTHAGGSVILSAQKMGAEITRLTVANPCSNEDYLSFSNAFLNATVQSGSHGLGLVLIKEFAQKINSKVSLAHENNQVILRMDIS